MSLFVPVSMNPTITDVLVLNEDEVFTGLGLESVKKPQGFGRCYLVVVASLSTSEIWNSFWVTTLRQKKSQISNGPPTGPKDVNQNMIKGQRLFKLQALCSHVVFHVRLRPAALAAALVSDGSPAAPERRHRLQPWLTGVQRRPFLVNWWQMLASFGALTRSSGRPPPFTRRGFQCLWILKQFDCFSLFCSHFRAEVSGN